MFYSQRKSIYRPLSLIHSKPTLLRQVVTNMLWKRMMAEKIKGNTDIFCHLSSATNRIQFITRNKRDRILYIKTLFSSSKYTLVLEMTCDLSAQSTTGTVCGPYKQVRVQSSHCAILHNNQWIEIIFALKILLITVTIQCRFTKTMNKCTFEISL